MSKYDFQIDLDENSSTGKILRYVTFNSKVLEFGPATGRMTRYMKEELNCDVYIVEIDQEAYAEAITYAKDGVCSDASKYTWCEKFKGIKFDCIIFADVLEHLYNPEQVLEKTQDFLNEDGFVIFSVPNIAHNDILMNLYNNRFQYTPVGILDETHIRFFAYDSLVPFTEKAGYEIVEEDATIREAFSTEQNFSTTEDMKTFFSEVSFERELRNVYQFVCKLQKKSYICKNDISKTTKILPNAFGVKSNFFFDRGEGFNEEKKIVVSPNKLSIHSYLYQIQFEATDKSIRFDPVEGKGCIVKNIEIISNNGPLKAINLNGFQVDNYNIFTNTDSQFLIDFEEKEMFWIKIKADIFTFEEMTWFDLLSKFKGFYAKEAEMAIALEAKINDIIDYNDKNEKIQSELEHFKTHYTAALNQREDLKRQLAEVAAAYTTISTSSSWRMTKPLRVTLDLIKKLLKFNRMTWIFYKGLKCLKENGFNYTLHKVKYRLSSKAQMKEYYKSHILSEEEKEDQKNTVFEKNIKFSILVPIYNTPENYLKEMIDSVLAQTYNNWELCLVDGSDKTHRNVRKICEKYSKVDKRILYHNLGRNLGISGNTNKCVEMATGDYIALFDHDDLLHPSALFENMKVICEKDADFIYSDENTFHDNPADAYNPHFKPDFAIDNLRANNYICHFTVFNKNLLSKAGLFRSECDGSQDFDMVLRLTEQAQHIVHIPKILYYWRAHKNSVASDISAKPYVIEAAKKAVSDHLKRVGLEGEVINSSVISTYKINYEIKGIPLISILIPNKDHVSDLKKCIGSILEKSTYKNFEIVIIENNSIEESTFSFYKDLSKYNNINVVTWEGGFNYSAINNFGSKFANGDYLLLLNNDVEVITPNWLEEMLMYAQRKEVGAVGSKLYYPDDTIQHAGIGIGLLTLAGHYHKHFPRSHPGYMARLSYAQDVSAVTGACMMVRKSLYKELSGLDETFEVAFNDVDLCMRIRKAGYLIVFTPYAELYHYESKSRGIEDTPEKRKRFQGEVLRFQQRWKKELHQGDPYYNPNLSVDREDFGLR